MFDTVARASPVARASSAWVNTVAASPSVVERSTSSTRRWFAARSDAVDPGAWSLRSDVMATLCTHSS
ncbi:hypothetical protein GCM10023066_03600 [Nocardioides kongjuensis]